MVAPAVVAMAKGQKRILPMPAGMDTRCRTTGMKRLAKRVSELPLRWKKRSVISRSCTSSSRYLPTLSTKGLPP